MIDRGQLLTLPFFDGLDPRIVDRLAAAAEVRSFDADDIIVHQHDRAIATYFLLSGSIAFLVHVGGVGDLLVGTTRNEGAMIGWSVFRAPYRHTATVRCEARCQMVRIPVDAFNELFAQDPRWSIALLRRVAAAMARRLEEHRDRLFAAQHECGFKVESAPFLASAQGTQQTPALLSDEPGADAVAGFLNHTTFFEETPTADIAVLAQHAYIERFSPGQTVFGQGAQADELYILVDGELALWFIGSEGSTRTLVRHISGAGQVLGWSALVEPHRYRASAVANGRARLLRLSAEDLDALSRHDAEFGKRLMERVLWLIGNRLQSARTQLIARRYHEDTLAVRALLEQAAATLHVDSPLHKVPYLLANRLTVADAFDSLELVRNHGDEVEQNVAALALDILASVRKELLFFQGLQRIYETVASAPPDRAPEQVRHDCMEAFRELYSLTDYLIVGKENLPPNAGHIFIMNHLENHPDNELPNGFRITMDTHFVASMILYPKYGRAPMRVVRKPPADRFGFQQYFDRLDYIYVYGGQADDDDRDHHITREDRMNRFLSRAHESLHAGDNLVICPEGKCYFTEDSPGPFKAGAFRLAATAAPEPLIVPIAVANFDKKLTRTRVAAMILPPLRLTDHVHDPDNNEELFAFVDKLNDRYRDYVLRTVGLTASGT